MISPESICPAARSSKAWAPHRPADARRDDAGASALSATTRAAGAAPLRLAFTYVPNGITMADWTPTGRGRRLRVLAGAEAAGAVPQGHVGALRPGAPERHGARRRPRRSRARRRLVSDRRASRARPPAPTSRTASRSIRSRRSTSARRRASRRSSSAATTRAPSATATRATPAPTPTAWRGADRRRRCRRRPTRASCSSACSATSTPACRRKRARGGCATAAASSISSASARPSCRRPRTGGPAEARRVPVVDPRDRAAHRARREGHDRPDAEHRQADRHPGAVRRLRQPDVRPAAHRLPDRHDPRRHDDDGARRQHADLSGDRRARSASSADPPPRQRRVDREGDQGERRCTWSCSPASSTR